MKQRLLILITLLVLAPPVHAGNSQVVAGAGPSTELTTLFFNAFNQRPECAGTTFTVMPGSIKHAGGLKNSDSQLFGRTGRPLSVEEKHAGKREILLGRATIGFAVGLETGVQKLQRDQLRALYTRKVTNWKQVGGNDAPVLLAGREPNEAVLKGLQEDLPWFKDVSFDQVLAKDDDVQKFIVSPAARHAIVFGAAAQLPERQLAKIEGLEIGIKVGLVYDLKNESQPLVDAVKKFATSPEWRAVLKGKGLLALH